MEKCTRKLIDAEAAKAAISKRLPGFYLDAALEALDSLPDASEGRQSKQAQQAGDGAEEE